MKTKFNIGQKVKVCGELITTIERIEGDRYYFRDETGKEWSEIEAAIEAAKQPESTKEILYRKVSVKDRLPKKEGWYFVWWNWKEGAFEFYSMDALYFNGEKFGTTEDDEQVTDWLEEIKN